MKKVVAVALAIVLYVTSHVAFAGFLLNKAVDMINDAFTGRAYTVSTSIDNNMCEED